METRTQVITREIGGLISELVLIAINEQPIASANTVKDVIEPILNIVLPDKVESEVESILDDKLERMVKDKCSVYLDNELDDSVTNVLNDKDWNRVFRNVDWSEVLNGVKITGEIG